MRYLKYILLFVLCTVYSIRTLYATDVATGKKILIICSYSSEYTWSNLIIDNFSAEIKKYNPHVELMVEYLSSERLVNAKMWTERVDLLLNSYAEDLPAALVLVSDEAWMTYRAVNNVHFKNVPLFLCAVKSQSISLEDYMKKRDVLSLTDFQPTEQIAKQYNATGVLRGMNVASMIDLMDKTIPNLTQYTLITDDGFYGVYLRLLFQDYVSKSNINKPVNYLDARFIHSDDLLANLPKITANTGVLLSSWTSGNEGFQYSVKYVYNNMSELMKTPVFITTDIGLSSGNFIGGCFYDSEIWGREVAEIVNRVIGGIEEVKIPIKTLTDSDFHINWNVLSKYKLPSDQLPASTIFINKPKSIFVEYKKELYLLFAVILVLTLCFIYVLRNNLKLGKAKVLAQQAIADANEKNQQLISAQETLQQALLKAENADKLKSAFLSNMDYQLRTPLNSIVGFSSLIPTFEDKSEIEFATVQIMENSEKLLKMVEDIIDLSQIESGNVDLMYEKVNLNSVFEGVVNEFANQINPQVKLIFAPPLMSISINTDSSRLAQILSNMTDNAIKFTQEGEVELGYFAVDNNTIEFYVKDTGIGIAENELAMIFDRFYNRDSYVSGMGFGLSISKKIVDLFKGQIGVSSTVGVGSRFWFRIRVDTYSKNL